MLVGNKSAGGAARRVAVYDILDINGTLNMLGGNGNVSGQNAFIQWSRPSAAGQSWFIGQEATGAFLVYNHNNLGVYLLSGQTSWSANSDMSLKKDVESLTPALDKIMALRPVTYHWTYEDSSSEPTHSGFIAQEVEQAIPELVDTDAQGKKAIRVTDMIPYLVRAVQELKSLIDK